MAFAGSSILSRLLVVGMAAASLLAVVLVPDWERRLHAQGYADGVADLAQQQLLEGERDKRIIERRIEEDDGFTFPRRGVFLTVHRDTIEQDGPNQKRDSNTPGFLAGYDYQVSDRFLAGIAGGLNVTLLDIDRSGCDPSSDACQLGNETATTFTYRVGPYFKYEGGSPWYAYGILLGGLRDIQTRREPLGVNGVVRGSTLGGQLNGTLGGGYDFYFGPLRLGPAGSFTYDAMWIGRYTERGTKGTAGEILAVRQLSAQDVAVRVGANSEFAFPTPWAVLVPALRLRFVYADFVDPGPAYVRYVKSNESGSTPLERPDPFFMEVGIGLKALLPDYWTLAVAYDENFLEQNTVRTRLSLTVRKQF